MKKSKLALSAFIFSMVLMAIGIASFLLFWDATGEVAIEDGYEPWSYQLYTLIFYIVMYGFHIVGTILIYMGYARVKTSFLVIALFLTSVSAFVLGFILALVHYALLIAAIIATRVIKNNQTKTSNSWDDSFTIY